MSSIASPRFDSYYTRDGDGSRSDRRLSTMQHLLVGLDAARELIFKLPISCVNFRYDKGLSWRLPREVTYDCIVCKVADYPFTTLVPNLGVCEMDYRTTVFADIPGVQSFVPPLTISAQAPCIMQLLAIPAGHLQHPTYCYGSHSLLPSVQLYCIQRMVEIYRISASERACQVAYQVQKIPQMRLLLVLRPQHQSRHLPYTDLVCHVVCT